MRRSLGVTTIAVLTLIMAACGSSARPMQPAWETSFVRLTRGLMAKTFGTDSLIQAADPMEAATFYVKELGFAVTDEKPNMVSLRGKNINFFIERGPSLGPVFEVTVKSVQEAKARLQKKGCQIAKDEPDSPRCDVKDPNGLIYNLTE